MKKLLIIVCCLCAVFAFTSCGANSEPAETEGAEAVAEADGTDAANIPLADDMFEIEDSAYDLWGSGKAFADGTYSDMYVDVYIKVRNKTDQTFSDVSIVAQDVDKNGDILLPDATATVNNVNLAPDQAIWIQHQDEYSQECDSIEELASRYAYYDITGMNVCPVNGEWETYNFSKPIRIDISKLKPKEQ